MTKYKPPFLKIHEYETDSYVIIGVVDDEQMETLQESFPLKSKIPAACHIVRPRNSFRLLEMHPVANMF